MSAPQSVIEARGLHTIYLAAAFAALAVPLFSAALLIAGPALLEFQTFTHLVMPAVFGVNLANLLLFVGISRAHKGPDQFRNFLSIGAVFSGICLSIVVVLGGMFSSLG